MSINMTMKTHWRLVTCGMVIAAMFAVVVICIDSQDSINNENLASIRDGMRQADVEKILGQPATFTKAIPYQYFTCDANGGIPSPSTRIGTTHTWVGRAMTIRVDIEKTGIVTQVSAWKRPRLLQRIRSWNQPQPVAPPPWFWKRADILPD